MAAGRGEEAAGLAVIVEVGQMAVVRVVVAAGRVWKALSGPCCCR